MLSYILCSPCSLLVPNSKIELAPIYESSKYSGGYPLSNLLLAGDTYWASKCKDQEAYFVLAAKSAGAILIHKVKIRPHIGLHFNKMEIYLGKDKEQYTLAHTITQAEKNITIDLLSPTTPPAKFIKFYLYVPNNCHFAIYEVEIFGIELPE